MGGKVRRRNLQAKSTVSRMDNKSVVFAAVQRGGPVRAMVVPDATAATISERVMALIHPTAHLRT